jgi:ABC-2 type transport system permease protein
MLSGLLQPDGGDACIEGHFLRAEPAATLKINFEWATEAQTAKCPAAFAQSSPGMLVMFAIFGLTASAMVLVLKRKTRTLQRLLTITIQRAEIIGGHLLAMFGPVFVQGLLLIVCGQLVLGVDYAREPLAVLAALALWVASLGLFIGAAAKGEDQVVLFAMFIFSALGGAWFPLETAGQAFATVGRLTPSAWAMTGFQNILIRGLNFNSALVPAGVMLAYAAAFFGLAVWRFKVE